MHRADAGHTSTVEDLISELVDCARSLDDAQRDINALKKQRYQLIHQLSQLGFSLRQIARYACLSFSQIRNIMKDPLGD